MSCINDILAFNRRYVAEGHYEKHATDKYPYKKLAVLSCMDTRLSLLLADALGLQNGDAKIIKNAGAVIPSPWDSAMRSLVVAVYELGVEEIMVVAHYHCGACHMSFGHFRDEMLRRGVPESELERTDVNLDDWLEGFHDPEDSVRKTVSTIVDHPLMPKDITVRGFVIDPATGELHEVSQNDLFKVSDILSTPPVKFSTPLQQKVYEAFEALGIPFKRVDTDPGLTMEDCQHIDAKIGVRIVKTVFLCNRQQTGFWLYVTSDDKPFVTREFCAALGGIPRVSFASAEKLQELTGVQVGATTILSAILPECAQVQLVMDKAIAESEWFACTDGTPTCFVKLRTADLLDRYLPSTNHDLTII